MKKIALALLIILFCVAMNAQKKKDAQSHKIKSTTVYNEDYEDNKGKPVKESVEKFDVVGNTIEEIEYDKGGKEKKHILYEYDNDGNKTKETYLKADGTKEKVIEYKYVEGVKTERIVYQPVGKLKSKKRYVYEYHK
jgi:hypothetical protein